MNLLPKQYLFEFGYNVSYRLNLLKRIWPSGKDKIVALMYHGIINSYPDNPVRNISAYNILKNKFEEQMSYLASHCNVISISDAIAGKGISSRKKNVILSFDDGYRNNYTNAFPVLLRYKLPALFSLPTAFVVGRMPLWNDVIECAVAATNRQSAHIKWNNSQFDFRLATISQKSALFWWLFSKCVEIKQEERELFIANTLQELDLDVDNNELLNDADYAPLSAKEINIMQESGIIEFASHSVNHFSLSRVSQDTLKSELANSKLAIERITGVPCRYFTIPGGFYNEAAKNEMLVNYEKVFSSAPRESRLLKTDGVIGRYCVMRYLSTPLFIDLVSG